MTDTPDSPQDEARTPSVPREKLLAAVDLFVKFPNDDIEKLSDSYLAGMVMAAMDLATTEHRLTHDGITTIDDVNGYAMMLMGMTEELSPTWQSRIISQITLHSIAFRNSIVRQAMRPSRMVDDGRHNYGEAVLHLIGMGLCQAGMTAELLTTDDPDDQRIWLDQVVGTAEAASHAAQAMRAILRTAPPPQRSGEGAAFFRVSTAPEKAPQAEA